MERVSHQRDSVSDPDHPHSWWSVQPTALIPAVVSFVNVQGYTQPGSSRNTLPDGDNAVIRVELDGSRITQSGPFVGRGLHFRDTVGLVSGLAINGFSDSSGILAERSTTTIEGNFVGTDVSGTRAPQGLPDLSVVFSSTPYGIHVVEGNARIGGDPGERNVIAGSAAGVVLRGVGTYRVAGNFVGTDRTGTKGLGNRVGIGTVGATGAVIGTDASGSYPLGRNVISGNRYGIVFNGTSDPSNDDGNHTVAGNFIGVGVAGQPLGNVGAGIGVLTGASDIMIGGPGAAMGNVIAYNGNDPIPGVPRGPGIAITNFVEAPARIGVLGNSIHSNSGLGIDLFAAANTVFPDGVTGNDAGDTDAGPNGLQNFPVLVFAQGGPTTTVQGTLNSTPYKTFTNGL